jgi:hypothetical protein
MIQQMSKWLLQGNNLAFATIGFVFGVMFLYIIYNTMSFYILREKYHGIRFTTKNIAYITMFTAISVSITIVISLTIPITVFPPIRVAFEGIMVKITGFIFGPIVGIVVGLITELLVTIFVPSFIHPAYVLVTIAYGFVSGVGASFLRAGKGKEWIIVILIHLFVILFGSFMYVIIDAYDANIKVLGFEVSPKVYQFLFVGILASILVMVWLIIIIVKAREYHRIKVELKNLERRNEIVDYEAEKAKIVKENKKHVLRFLLPIILFATASEFIVTTLISAWGDAEFLGIKSDGGYSAMMIGRLVQAPIKILFNSFVLFFTYTAVRPLIKRDR